MAIPSEAPFIRWGPSLRWGDDDMTTLFLPGPLWMVGCGNMGSAMLARWLAAGVDAAQITVVRPSGRAVAEGVRVLTALPEDEVPAIALLAMKPRQLDEVAALLAPALDPASLLVSILAGVEQASLRARFPAVRSVVRAMPNLPVSLGKGVVNLFGDDPGEPGEAAGKAAAGALMEPLGHVEWFAKERQFQIAGIVTGAGPAFLLRYVDALAQGARSIGLAEEKAERLALAMAEGASSWAAAASESPDQLAARVASAGGTTQAGLDVLDADEALRRLVLATLEAALGRSDAMAAKARPG